MKKLIIPITIILLIGQLVFVSAESTYNVQVAKGWNLVPKSYFFWSSAGDKDGCTQNFKYAFFYDYSKKEYFGGKIQTMGANKNIFQFVDSNLDGRFAQIFDGKLKGLDVAWVYSSADCSIVTNQEPSYDTSQKQFPDFQLKDISDIQLFEGWNFFYIPDYWKDGDSFKDYLGNCDVTRVAVWDFHSQQWSSQVNNMSVSDTLTQLKISPLARMVSFPILLKVNQNCNLGYIKNGGSPSAPPGLPDSGNSNPIANCTDSDGGANYYVKGTTRGLNSFGEGNSATDYCVYAGQAGTYGQYLQAGQSAVMEYICSNTGSMNDDLHVCDKGCQDGACIQ